MDKIYRVESMEVDLKSINSCLIAAYKELNKPSPKPIQPIAEIITPEPVNVIRIPETEPVIEDEVLLGIANPMEDKLNGGDTEMNLFEEYECKRKLKQAFQTVVFQELNTHIKQRRVLLKEREDAALERRCRKDPIYKNLLENFNPPTQLPSLDEQMNKFFPLCAIDKNISKPRKEKIQRVSRFEIKKRMISIPEQSYTPKQDKETPQTFLGFTELQLHLSPYFSDKGNSEVFEAIGECEDLN
ncbi:hypothetical protein Ciccas_000591 [Cichlidogyrus casuarinus]|uniref:Uncharacterized protein n=1 Tax=Cichlidogyrus casuarinus TaxID=1844966 RepID=A0ABD2QNL0_9PLAT